MGGMSCDRSSHVSNANRSLRIAYQPNALARALPPPRRTPAAPSFLVALQLRVDHSSSNATLEHLHISRYSLFYYMYILFNPLTTFYIDFDSAYSGVRFFESLVSDAVLLFN